MCGVACACLSVVLCGKNCQGHGGGRREEKKRGGADPTALGWSQMTVMEGGWSGWGSPGMTSSHRALTSGAPRRGRHIKSKLENVIQSPGSWKVLKTLAPWAKALWGHLSLVQSQCGRWVPSGGCEGECVQGLSPPLWFEDP